jgi:hypothetical protein
MKTSETERLIALLEQSLSVMATLAAAVGKTPAGGAAAPAQAPRRDRIAPDGTFETLLQDATPGAREVLTALRDGTRMSFDRLLAGRKASYEAATGKEASDAESRAALGRTVRWAKKVASEHGFDIDGDKDSGYQLFYPTAPQSSSEDG